MVNRHSQVPYPFFSSLLKMENRTENDNSLSLPMLADDFDKAEKGIGSGRLISNGKTSFLKTTFHGLNALSGSS